MKHEITRKIVDTIIESFDNKEALSDEYFVAFILRAGNICQERKFEQLNKAVDDFIDYMLCRNSTLFRYSENRAGMSEELIYQMGAFYALAVNFSCLRTEKEEIENIEKYKTLFETDEAVSYLIRAIHDKGRVRFSEIESEILPQMNTFRKVSNAELRNMLRDLEEKSFANSTAMPPKYQGDRIWGLTSLGEKLHKEAVLVGCYKGTSKQEFL